MKILLKTMLKWHSSLQSVEDNQMKNTRLADVILSMIALVFWTACSNPSEIPAPPERMEHGQSAGAAAAAYCDNIFYPLAANNSWSYRLNIDQVAADGNPDLVVSVSESTPDSALISTSDFSTGQVTQSLVTCRQGAVVDFPVTELNLVLGMFSGDLDLKYESGIFMPSQEEFESNDWALEWETMYRANGNVRGSYEGDTITAELIDSPVKMRWKVIGTDETLDIPAGKFENLVKIERVITFDVSKLQTTIEGSEVNISTTLNVVMVLWYAPHVGLVNQDIESASVKFYGISIPVKINGSLELLEYSVQ
jgi:hypothetical protein